MGWAKIDALWRRTKKRHGDSISQYDWGWRDGLFAARALFKKPPAKKRAAKKAKGKK